MEKIRKDTTSYEKKKYEISAFSCPGDKEHVQSSTTDCDFNSEICKLQHAHLCNIRLWYSQRKHHDVDVRETDRVRVGSVHNSCRGMETGKSKYEAVLLHAVLTSSCGKPWIYSELFSKVSSGLDIVRSVFDHYSHHNTPTLKSPTLKHRYRCDRKSVAFWDGQSGDTGSVPIDFTNPDVIEWQIRNQSVHASNLGYDMMAFDNYGGGARAGANPGQACGVFDSDGNWHYRFGQNSTTFNDTQSQPEMIEYSVKWIESAHTLMQNITPTLGIIPNLCIDNAGWLDTDNAKRVMASVTGVLSERGFSGWGSQRVEEAELLDEFRWMKKLSSSNKTYYSINEIKQENFNEEWLEFSLGAFYIGYVPGASIWIGGIQAYVVYQSSRIFYTIK